MQHFMNFNFEKFIITFTDVSLSHSDNKRLRTMDNDDNKDQIKPVIPSVQSNTDHAFNAFRQRKFETTPLMAQRQLKTPLNHQYPQKALRTYSANMKLKDEDFLLFESPTSSK